MKIRSNSVAVVMDDHKLVASMFGMLLEKINFFSIVHICETKEEIMDVILSNNYTTVWLFLDYFVPGVNINYLISDMRKLRPGVKIAIVSHLSNVALIRKLLAYRVDGIISKADDVDEIVSLLQSESRQTPYLSSTISKIFLEGGTDGLHLDFTVRELDVLSLIANGLNMNEISLKLNLSKNTVISYRRNLLAKSGFRSITELVAFSIKSGIVSQ